MARAAMCRYCCKSQRDGLKRGVVTLCIGGGQGIALALEDSSVIVFGITQGVSYYERKRGSSEK